LVAAAASTSYRLGASIYYGEVVARAAAYSRIDLVEAVALAPAWPEASADAGEVVARAAAAVQLRSDLVAAAA
jgi:hypothetical protein